MISVNFRENKKQEMVWTLTEMDQMAHGRWETKDGVIMGIVNWEKYGGTLQCHVLWFLKIQLY